MTIDVAGLNLRYRALTPLERVSQLYMDFDSVLLTSSFGATSAMLLSIFSKVNKQQQVHFIDTSYHFPETLKYKDQLAQILGLDVMVLAAEQWKNEFTLKDETWKKDPDLCCSINKVEPVDLIRNNYQVWASGLMSSQTDHRRSLNIFEMRDDNLRFYPLVDQKESDAYAYIESESLPQHPLMSSGYFSIGCKHCTTAGEGRSGRWINKAKTECGLHVSPSKSQSANGK